MSASPQFEYRKKQLRLQRVFTVAILAMACCVILFPVFARARGKIGEGSCAANLRQIGMAMVQYSADFDGRFPAGVDPSDKALPQMWAAQPKFATKVKQLPLLQATLRRYLTSQQVFHCPADSGGLVMENTFGTNSKLQPFISSPTMFANYGTSYLFRTEIAFKSMSIKGWWPDEKTAVLFDGYGHWHGNSEPLSDGMDYRRADCMVRNDYRYNVLYGDGHVQTLNFQQLEGTWARRL